MKCMYVILTDHAGVFGIVYDGFLSNAAEEVEGATPVIIKTVKGNTVVLYVYLPCSACTLSVCWLGGL